MGSNLSFFNENPYFLLQVCILPNFSRSDRIIRIFCRGPGLSLMIENVFVIDLKQRDGVEAADRLRTALQIDPPPCLPTGKLYGIVDYGHHPWIISKILPYSEN